MPKEIDFGDADPYCTGLSGTSNTVLNCVPDRSAKTIRFTNAMQFATANPGTMVILIESLKNPSENAITSSFGIFTESNDGYEMDKIFSDITVNFYCEYPCENCMEDKPSFCLTCYQTSVERYFH